MNLSKTKEKAKKPRNGVELIYAFLFFFANFLEWNFTQEKIVQSRITGLIKIEIKTNLIFTCYTDTELIINRYHFVSFLILK